MAEDADTLEITLEEPEKKVEEAEIEVLKAEEEPKPEAKVLEPAEGLEKLKADLDRERNARVDAERREREASEREVRAQTEVQDSNLSLVVNAIETVKQSSDMLEGQYAEAAASGDWGAASKIQRAMSENAAKLLQLEQGKQALEAQPKPVVQQRQITDPVEVLASQLTPRSADWIRRNPSYATDNRLYQRMLAAHNLAVTDGLAPDSDAYFSAIEETLDIAGRRRAAESQARLDVVQQDDALSSAATPTQRRVAPPAAPVSRSGNGTGDRPGVVRLSAQEREMAEMMGMTDKEYAINKVALKKEGRLQ